MDRGAWQATVHGVPRVGHDSATLKKKNKQVLVGIVLKAGDGAVNKSKRKTLPSWNLHLSNGNQEIISAVSLPPGRLARECPFPGGPQEESTLAFQVSIS